MTIAPTEQHTAPVTFYNLAAIPGPLKRISPIPGPNDYICAGHPLWSAVERLGAILWQEVHDGKGGGESLTDEAIRRRGLDLMRAEESIAPYVRSVAEATLVLHSIINEAVGGGPLEAYLRDESVREILAVGPHAIYVRREEGMQAMTCCFVNWRHMLRVVENLMHQVGRCLVQEAFPLNVRLQEGVVLTVTATPGVNDGPMLVIDKRGYTSSSSKIPL